jgi:hypothetical protein
MQPSSPVPPPAWTPPPAAAPRRRPRWRLLAGAGLAVLAFAAAGLVVANAGRASGDPAPAAGATALAPGGQPLPAVPPAARAVRPLGGPGRGLFGGAGGTLTAIGPTSLTVRGLGGRSVTFATTAATGYYRDAAKVSRSALKVGDRVAVRVADPRASTPTAGAVWVLLPDVVGTVSGVQAGAFTLTEPVGFRHLIHTAAGTAYQSAGRSASRATVLRDGALVRAVGTIEANGTDLDASRVEALPAGGPRGHRWP